MAAPFASLLPASELKPTAKERTPATLRCRRFFISRFLAKSGGGARLALAAVNQRTRNRGFTDFSARTVQNDIVDLATVVVGTAMASSERRGKLSEGILVLPCCSTALQKDLNRVFVSFSADNQSAQHLISLCPVDQVFHRPAVAQAPDCVGNARYHRLAFHAPRRVRHDGNLRVPPERIVLRQAARSGTRRAWPQPGAQNRAPRSGPPSTTWPPRPRLITAPPFGICANAAAFRMFSVSVVSGSRFTRISLRLRNALS